MDSVFTYLMIIVQQWGQMTNIILGEAGDGAGVYFFMGVTGVTTGSRGGTPDFK